ncbi:hypothetical protein AALC75_22805 [Lachnospiraceae bacterium 48-42]
MKDLDEYNNIKVFLHFEPDKGHNSLNPEDAISFLYQILEKISRERFYGKLL